VGAAGGPASGRVLGANDRIRLAVIGCGGMGSGHVRQLTNMSKSVDLTKDPDLNMELVAVCDVYDAHTDRAAKVCGGKGYRYYRDMLEKEQLDGAVIATPDHWHAQNAIDCMDAGLDVYLQKPMTLYWEEAKKVRDKVEETQRVLQVGAQGCSDDAVWKAAEVVKSGVLGPMVWSQCGAYRNVPGGDWNYGLRKEAVPGQNLDWNEWLGPAPKRPYDIDRFSNFRKFWDYSGGLATDLLYHSLSHMLIICGPQFPTRVVATGGNVAAFDREVPDNFHVLCDYEKGWTMAMHATGANQQGLPEVVRGQYATLYLEGPGVVVRPEEPYKDKVQQREIGREHRDDHMVNFLRCMRNRNAPHLDAETGYRTQVPIALSCLAFRRQREVRFDPEKEKVVG
jgi:predicted dehydrogenase